MPLKAERILWPTDFSKLSLHGGRYARCFRKLFDAELHMIHVLQLPMPTELSLSIPAEFPIASSELEMIAAAKASLERVIAEHFEADPSIKHDVFFGNAWSGICEYATQHKIDMIVVSTHGRTGLQHVLIGSTAERIVQHAPCPVFVVKNPANDFLTGDDAPAD